MAGKGGAMAAEDNRKKVEEDEDEEEAEGEGPEQQQHSANGQASQQQQGGRDGGGRAEEDDGAFNRTDRLLRHPLGSAARYYTVHYLLGQQEGYDQWVYEHPNGVFVIGLVVTHVGLASCRASGGCITKVDFSPSQDGLGGTSVKGKKKRGASNVKATAVLATITCSSGEVFNALCGMEGQLLEVNSLLSPNPNALLQEGEDRGFLAIIQPPRFREPDRTGLLTAEEYETRVAGRGARKGIEGDKEATGMVIE